MEPPTKPSQQPHSPYIKKMLLPGIGHNKAMSLSGYPRAESSEPGSLPTFRKKSTPRPGLRLSSYPVPCLGEPQSDMEGRIPPWRALVGVSFLRAGLFFSEAKGSLKLVWMLPLWVSQGHGGGSSNSPAWHHSHKYPASPLRSQQIEGNVLRGFSSCWEIAGLRNVL